MPQYRLSDPWKDRVRPVFGGLIILAILKGAAALAGGGGVLLAQAGYTAAEALLLASGAAAPRAEPARTGLNAISFILLQSFLVFAGGCSLLWGGLLYSFENASPELSHAVLFIIFAETMFWLWIFARMKRLRSLAAAAAEHSCRRDLLLLLAAGTALLAAYFGAPAVHTVISAGIAVLILLQSLHLARGALNSLDQTVLPVKLLTVIRDKAAAVAGVSAIHKIKGRWDGGYVSVELWVMLSRGFERCDAESVSTAIRDTLKMNFQELSRVYVATISLSEIPGKTIIGVRS